MCIRDRYNLGVTQENFEFYIGTHPHSDHIGTADEVIEEFHPKRVYIQEYKDSYISNPAALWDNLYVYDQMLQDVYKRQLHYFLLSEEKYQSSVLPHSYWNTVLPKYIPEPLRKLNRRFPSPIPV